MNRKIIRLAELVHEANENTPYDFLLSFDSTRFSLSVSAHHSVLHATGSVYLAEYVQFMGDEEEPLLDNAIRDVHQCIHTDLAWPTRILLAKEMLKNLEKKNKPGHDKLVAHYLNLDYDVVGGMLNEHRESAV